MTTTTDLSKTFIKKAMKEELLEQEEELRLARNWRNHGDEKSLHKLVNAYMRLAVSMSAKYRRYGADMTDLTQEAGIGLMKAAEKFDPERGVRFSTYAVWWIKASIQDYVMRNWSMVRTGSTSSQKALFFNLKRVKARLERKNDLGDASVDNSRLKEMIAEELGVRTKDVEMMESRLSGSDYSLNAPQSDDEGREWIEILEDDDEQSAIKVEKERDLQKVRKWLAEAMHVLNDRERMIVLERKMRDEPRTLESLGGELGLSKERIRQLENQALAKLRRKLEAKSSNLSKVFV